MNHLSSFAHLSRAKKVSATLIAVLIAGTVGIPAFFQTASAAQLSNISATASSTVPSTATNYLIKYTQITAATNPQTIVITLDPTGQSFVIGALVYTDIVASGMTVVNTCTAAASEVLLTSFTNNPDVITLTVCTGDTVAAGAKDIAITNNRITNPATPGSYKVNIAGTQTDSGDAIVAIVNQVTMTAGVDATLLFTIAGVASGQTINGESVSTTSTATGIGFGTLASGTPVVAAQDLTVTTNAANGFMVTVHEDQDMIAGNGSTIHLFNDGAAVASPIGWATPTAALGNVATYGHIGLTSDDTDLNSNEFYSSSVIKWAGNFNATSSRTIFANAGPADGTTQNIGKARVGYKILVSALQAAGSDYMNHLIYVCTPTF